jgi:hypothetical protein
MERAKVEEENEGPQFEAATQDFFAHQIAPALHRLPSFHGWRYGVGCTKRGIVLNFADWHEVDAATAALGSMLRRDDLREEITLCYYNSGEELTK